MMTEVNVEKRRTGATGERRENLPTMFEPRWGGDLLSLSPFAFMRRFGDEVDRMFTGHGQGSQWWPAMEVTEKDGNMLVRADLPGLHKDDVKIEVTDNALRIEGERKSEHEDSRQGYFRSERSYGHFSRTIVLPKGAGGDQARAQFKDGVLEVTIPVPKETAKSRQVPIERSR